MAAFKIILFQGYISIMVVSRSNPVELCFNGIYKMTDISSILKDGNILFTREQTRTLVSFPYPVVRDTKEKCCLLFGRTFRCVCYYYAVKIYIGKEYLDFEFKISYDVWCDIVHIETNEIYLITQWVTDKIKEIIHELNDHYISGIDINEACYYGRFKGYAL